MDIDTLPPVFKLPMTPSPELLEFIKGWESCRLTPYVDGGGVLTCGWGHTGPDVNQYSVWSQDYADSVFAADVRQRANALRPYIHRDASQQQFDALVSLAYNAGPMAIGNSGLLARFNSGLDDEAAIRFLLWNKDNGHVVDGLTKRREAEMKIFTQGDYSGRP